MVLIFLTLIRRRWCGARTYAICHNFQDVRSLSVAPLLLPWMLIKAAAKWVPVIGLGRKSRSDLLMHLSLKVKKMVSQLLPLMELAVARYPIVELCCWLTVSSCSGHSFIVSCTKSPHSSDREYLCYGVCLEVRGEIIRTVLCCIVYDSCAHWDEQFLQFSGLGFVTLGAFHCAEPRFICVYMCVYCAFVFHTAYMWCYCQHSGVDLVGLKPNP